MAETVPPVAPDDDEDRYKIDVGKRLAHARKALTLSQPQFAKLFGWKQQSVSRWERGVDLPPPYEWLKVCRAHVLTASWLYEGKSSAEVDTRIMHKLLDARD